MQPEIRACLHDVLQAITETEGFFAGQPLDFTRYQQDVRTRRATERNLEIMGEAVGRILKLEPAFALTSARQIIATRNRIIHGYDTVSDEMVWSIVVRHLPLLKAEVVALLGGE
ncbi:Uncharacterized conserved protein, contains HEPN domain [Hymenobacter daecheongensis DSM 21074]|uniref:Uncharacterized conserved protein, contains HEPN domain n=1 Tax=Hymenobacter daecheongensis DSM 21074 TaxID=1121955 RepID=A0A1M6JTR4_9BACT|nr:HepT-like ribonuclease domain-containing protein [Hymenobacter daecheongensis]SHJ50071.1 Uncharacterized conserved protein, contains HEPN domain [Hymenobacter daecheongensis DSM 21074]